MRNVCCLPRASDACRVPVTLVSQLLELVPALAPYKKIIDDIIKGGRHAVLRRQHNFRLTVPQSPRLYSRRYFRRVSPAPHSPPLPSPKYSPA